MANNTSTEEPTTDATTEVVTTLTSSKNNPPLSTLCNPSWEFLHRNYTKYELQKYCNQLQLGGIWTTKEKLIDKLRLHYSSQSGSSSSSTSPSTDVTQTSPSPYNRERDNEDRNIAELLEKFESFVRETKDNFYVVNNTLTEKEREIQDLKSRIFLAEEKIKTLQEKLLSRDEDNGGLGYNPVPRAKKTLLIGDSCLQEIKAGDLKENVAIRTLPVANMSLIKSWIVEKLDHPLTECIVYGGAQDILEEEKNPETILDELGDIVSELKSKNENITVKVCELVPSLKSVVYVDKINLYNHKLLNWCSNNAVTLIRTGDYFRLGTGEVDVNCYDNSDNQSYDNLSRIGAVRLLDAIASSCQSSFVVDDWREIKQNVHKSNNVRRKSVTLNGKSDGSQYVNHNVRFKRNSRHDNDGCYNSFSYNVNSSHGRNGHANSRNNLNRPRYDNYNHYPNKNRSVNRNTERENGCYNCGEFNHRQTNCRYDHKLKCNYCHEYGHKIKFCRGANIR